MTQLSADVVDSGRYEVTVPDTLLRPDVMVTDARLFVYGEPARVVIRIQAQEDYAGGDLADDFHVQRLTSSCSIVDLQEWLEGEVSRGSGRVSGALV